MRSPLIEFRNDGQTDSLTKSPAPAIFLTALEREFSSAMRDKRAMTIISFVSASPSTIHADISGLARALKKSCRSSEPYSRISEDGFWVKGVRVPADDREYISVYNAFREWLVWQGLTREIEEEIGGTIKDPKLIPIEKFTSDDNNFEYHTYVIKVDEEFLPELNREHRGYCWVPLDDYPKPLHPGVWRTFKFASVVDKLHTIERLA